jgi:hypothetical protein
MTTTNGEQAPPPARQSRPQRVPATRQKRNPTHQPGLDRHGCTTRQAKQGQISPLHSHQVLIFKIKGIA